MIFRAFVVWHDSMQLVFQLFYFARLGLFVRPAVQDLPGIIVHHCVYVDAFFTDGGEGLENEPIIPSDSENRKSVTESNGWCERAATEDTPTHCKGMSRCP